MAHISDVPHVKLVCAVCFSQNVLFPDIEQRLASLLGPVEDRSEVFDFSFTEYYSGEMGSNLKKRFISFTNTIFPGDLPGIKVKTNELEQEYAEHGRRKVNIDPGYLTGAKLVVASAKNFAHRIYIGKGIYGDLQLQYRHNRFWPHAWTFPDYQTDTVLQFLEQVRKTYLHGDIHGKIDTV